MTAEKVMGSMAGQKTKGRILVVDDEESVGIGISELLKDEGYEAAYAISGKDAVAAVREGGISSYSWISLCPA